MKTRNISRRRDFIRGGLAALSALGALSFSGASLAAGAVGVSSSGHPSEGATVSRLPVLLVLGDSLSAEFGLARGQGWVALLAERIKERHIPMQVVNSSISGNTTAEGLERLGALLTKYRPALVIIELGGNDALRGLDLETSRANLARMTRMAREQGAKVVLTGIQIPPNYGAQYAEQFAHIYPQVAHEEHCALVPFLLAKVADAPNARDLFQTDGIHPVAAAHPIILDNVWSVLALLLAKPKP